MIGQRTRATIRSLFKQLLAPMGDDELETRVATAASCVDLKSCRCEKFRSKPADMVRDVETAARDGLAAWGYVADPR